MNQWSSLRTGLLLLLLFAVPVNALADVTIREDRSTGRVLVVMENDLLEVKIAPRLSGRIIALLDKRTGIDYSASTDYGYGLYQDMLWQQMPFQTGDWIRRSYPYKLLEQDGRVGVQLEAGGKTGGLSWLTIRKTYWLDADSTEVEVVHEYTNDPNSMGTLTVCPWFHHVPNTAGQDARMFYPSSKGVGTRMFTGSPLNELFVYDVTAGWFGMTLQGTDAGLAFTFDSAPVMCLYNWQGKGQNTMEWMLRSQKIPSGQTFTTRSSVMTVKGLDRIDGVLPGLAGAFLRKDQAITGLRLYAAQPKTAELHLTLRRLPGRLVRPLKTTTVNLQPGRPAVVPLDVTPSQPGTYVLRCSVGSDEESQQVLMETPFVVGQASGDYEMKPLKPRTGDPDERFGQILRNKAGLKDPYRYTNTIKTSHVPWYKPSSAGTLRVMAVCDMHAARELIELAERMDIDLSTCTYSSSGRASWTPFWGWNGGVTEINAYLEKLLEGDYDCILIGGMVWKNIDPENRKKLLEKVRSGTGLLSIMPIGQPEDCKELFPARLAQAMGGKQLQDIPAETAITATARDDFALALPLTGLPPLHIVKYTPRGSVILEASDRPLLTTGSAGKGRTALLSWLVGSQRNATHHLGLTPYLPRPTDYPYQEYFFQTIIKTLRWVARRPPQLRLAALSCPEETLSLNMENTTDEDLALTAEILVRHHSGQVLKRLQHKLTCPPGKASPTVPLDTEWMHGKHFIDVRLFAQDAVADFGSLAVHRPGVPGIAEVSTPQAILQNGQTLDAGLTLTALPAKPEVVCTLIDAFDRVLAERRIVPDATSLQLALTVEGIYAHRARLRVDLLSKGRLLDRQAREVLLAPPPIVERRWEQYRMMLGWPRRSTPAFPWYLHDAWLGSLRKIGINSVLLGAGHQRHHCHLHYRLGQGIVLESVARMSPAINPDYPWKGFDYRHRRDTFLELKEKYSETGDTKYLHREPSLEDPAFRKLFEKTYVPFLEDLTRWHVLNYDLGDESSYAYFTDAIDFDFSPVSIKAFRQWLQTQYDSLDALNASWKRDFASWDEVIPDTGHVARQRKHYASWSDHRTYNEKVFTDFYRFVIGLTRKVDPKAVAGISGTQIPRAYGGYDYTRLMPLFDTLSVYTSAGLPAIYRSFKTIPMQAWVGYAMSEDQIWKNLWSNLFGGCYGAAIYNEDVILNPDLTLTERGEWIRHASEPIRRGVGTLVHHATRVRPTVAIHYSQPSVHAAWTVQGDSEFVKTRMGWLDALADHHLPCRFLDRKALEDGALVEQNFQAIVLPFSQAMSDAEIQALRDFLDAGGAVLADKDPGRLNEHCGPTETDRLGELFRTHPRAILLGYFPEGYRLEEGGTHPKLRKAMGEVFARAKLAPPLPLLTPGQLSVQPTFYRLGKRGTLIGMIAGETGTLKLNLPEQAVAYDVLAGRELAEPQLLVRANRPAMLALLPYRVEGLDVRLEQDGRELRATAAIPPAGEGDFHVLRFDVLDSDGKTLAHYSRCRPAPAGRAEHTWQPGLNETGPWTVRVTDILTGTSAEARLSPPEDPS